MVALALLFLELETYTMWKQSESNHHVSPPLQMDSPIPISKEEKNAQGEQYECTKTLKSQNIVAN